MKFLRWSLLALVLSAAGASVRADILVDLDLGMTIPGDSTDTNHAGQIAAVSYKLGVVQPTQIKYAGSGTGAGAGKSQFTPLTIYKHLDSASPRLILACALGTALPKATLTVASETDGSGTYREFFKIVMTDVTIASVNEDSETVDETGNIVESIILNFTKIQITYTPQKQDGSAGDPITTGFDLKANKKL